MVLPSLEVRRTLSEGLLGKTVLDFDLLEFRIAESTLRLCLGPLRQRCRSRGRGKRNDPEGRLQCLLLNFMDGSEPGSTVPFEGLTGQAGEHLVQFTICPRVVAGEMKNHALRIVIHGIVHG